MILYSRSFCWIFLGCKKGVCYGSMVFVSGYERFKGERWLFKGVCLVLLCNWCKVIIMVIVVYSIVYCSSMVEFVFCDKMEYENCGSVNSKK